jgi:RNA polymerase sigma factor (sigma-70 family)
MAKASRRKTKATAKRVRQKSVGLKSPKKKSTSTVSKGRVPNFIVRQESSPSLGLPESTANLLEEARAGDQDAENELVRRSLPELRRYARGRLPGYARNGLDTEDLVQETMLHALRRLPTFEPTRPGGLRAYLRHNLRNRVVDAVRLVQRKPAIENLAGHDPVDEHSRVEESLAFSRYERALKMLSDVDRQMIVARVELGLSYGDIALQFGYSSANIARVRITRALMRLADQMAPE